MVGLGVATTDASTAAMNIAIIVAARTKGRRASTDGGIVSAAGSWLSGAGPAARGRAADVGAACGGAAAGVSRLTPLP
jgi:hypothetical protein